MWLETLAQCKPTHPWLQCVQATFTRGSKLQIVLGCVDRMSSSSLAYCRDYTEAARTEASTKALASALWSVRGVKPCVRWRAAQESFCLVSSSRGAPRNLGLCGCSQPVLSQKNRQPQGSFCLRQIFGSQDYLLSFLASEQMGPGAGQI